MKHKVFITGCSTGIGKATALRLATLGYGVFAGVRKSEDGERLKEEAGKGVDYFCLDVTDGDQLRELPAWIETQLKGEPLHGLINNAGIVVSGPLECIAIEDLRHQFEVNVFGLLAVTQKLLPFLRMGPGRIVNLSSIAGKLAFPFMGPYSSSKFAVEALSDSLRRELRPQGIQVSVIEPGHTDTPIWIKSKEKAESRLGGADPKIMEMYEENLGRFTSLVMQAASHAHPVAAVVKAIEAALGSSHPRSRYMIGRDTKAQAVLAKFLPDKAVDRIISWRIESVQD